MVLDYTDYADYRFFVYGQPPAGWAAAVRDAVIETESLRPPESRQSTGRHTGATAILALASWLGRRDALANADAHQVADQLHEGLLACGYDVPPPRPAWQGWSPPREYEDPTSGNPVVGTWHRYVWHRTTVPPPLPEFEDDVSDGPEHLSAITETQVLLGHRQLSGDL